MNAKRMLVLAGISAAMVIASAAATCGDTTIRTDPGSGQILNGITVSGTGKTSIKPDIAQIQLGVSTLAPSVQEARDKAAQALDGMIASIKANGVADKDIQTQQLYIQPEYDYSNNQQTLRGFRISNVVSVKLRDINKTGKLVDDAVSAGGNETQIQGIAFTVENPDDAKAQAREKAVADAKQKAQTLAKAAGVQVGDVLQISESGYSPPMYDARSSFSGPNTGVAASPETPIQAGELDVSVGVSVTWSIK